jgi:hypothetical protein
MPDPLSSLRIAVTVDEQAAITRERYLWHKRMLDDTTLTTTDRLVGAALWDHASRGDARAHPGIKHLATRLGISERTVRRSLVNLRNRGWIIEIARGSVTEHRKWATVYGLEWPKDHRPPVATGPTDHRPLMTRPPATHDQTTGHQWPPNNP